MFANEIQRMLHSVSDLSGCRWDPFRPDDSVTYQDMNNKQLDEMKVGVNRKIRLL